MPVSLERRMHRDARRILRRASPRLCAAGVSRAACSELIAKALDLARGDLHAFADRDAAAGADIEYVYAACLSFRAVFAYRVGHLVYLLHSDLADGAARRDLRSAARLITEVAKVETGVEIHPAAAIGARFVIDHGSGTVIGEQVEIGCDGYLLQNVILGGRSIGHSSSLGGARRHPTIGDRVEIGAHAMVLGPVSVGDDCTLEPRVRVTCDVPARSRVRLLATLQVTVTDQAPELAGIVAPNPISRGPISRTLN